MNVERNQKMIRYRGIAKETKDRVYGNGVYNS